MPPYGINTGIMLVAADRVRASDYEGAIKVCGVVVAVLVVVVVVVAAAAVVVWCALRVSPPNILLCTCESSESK